MLFFIICNSAAFTQEIVEVKYKINNFGKVIIPGELEVQGSNIREMVDQELKGQGYTYELLQNKVVFQQKGLNKGESTDTYIRIIINTYIGKDGDYPIQEISEEDIAIAIPEIIKSLENNGIQIIKHNGIENVKIGNNYLAQKSSYIRKIGNNPNVYVTYYLINNGDRMHTITISYRTDIASVWEKNAEIILNSIELDFYDK